MKSIGGQHHADFDRDGQVDDDRQAEGGEEHGGCRRRGHLGRRAKLCHSPMCSATLTSTALSVASGMNFASGAATRMMTSSVTA